MKNKVKYLQAFNTTLNIFLQILRGNTHYYQTQYQKFICVAHLVVYETILGWFCVKTKPKIRDRKQKAEQTNSEAADFMLFISFFSIDYFKNDSHNANSIGRLKQSATKGLFRKN
jgi:hypothetical protein